MTLNLRTWAAPAAILFLAASPVLAAPALAFTVSMDRPETHYFHVELKCSGLPSGPMEFKLPLWSPGYYMMMDYPKNVMNFQARDAAGKPLPWRKTAKNAWRVEGGAGGGSCTVSYDVYAFARSIAESSLDDGQAFLSPTSLFMHPAGMLRSPVTVQVKPAPGWSRVDTGLQPVAGAPGTFAAPDFDVLYDSPILAGNQEVLNFEVQGVPHAFVGRDLGDFDRARFVADLQAMVREACRTMGDMPYTHYTFMAIGPGGGGLEHLNSQAITFDGNRLRDPAEYRKVMSFISHEYFHHFNVKRIRPITLGPFDYDRENYTDLLWLSEGFTVYYEDLVLVRDGFLARNDYFGRLTEAICKFEEIPGHRVQSVAESSFDTWFGYFGHNEHQENTTISYYDKGLALAVMLDFKIRHETSNAKCLDDVMRTLYRTYAKGLGRGFTEPEFRAVCEKTAGCPLPEIFEVYATTTRDLDYARYFAYAGMEIDTTPKALPGGWLGADLQERGGHAVIERVALEGPAQAGGLSVEDEVLALDGVRGNAAALAKVLLAHKAGDPVKVQISRRGKIRELSVTLGQQTKRDFTLRPKADAGPLEVAIRESWLKGR